ncbi:MAG: sigma-70 family RNA polymerase sigma factor [Clostridiales bacterium]|nr:sigma-70 family RNA polymerase sigma factor [Clostridiales bacterium]
MRELNAMSVSAYTDYEVIQACLAGDRDIFAELVKRYKNLVYSVILRMVNDHEEANDLAQDVFIKIYKNLDKYYPEYKFSTWVIRIATNHVIDYRRKKKQETVPIEDVEFSLRTEESPEGAYIRREQKEELRKIVGDLPDMYKIPIVLYHEQGLSYQEISEIINEPLSKVKNRIFRGRRMLKESLLKESLLNLNRKGSVGYGV